LAETGRDNGVEPVAEIRKHPQDQATS
jgi:hypothetical protein